MKIICKATLLAPEPPKNETRIRIAVTDPANPSWGIYRIWLAEGSGDYTIRWGDGTQTRTSEGTGITHEFPRIGTYEVVLSDDISSIRIAATSDLPPFSTIYPQMVESFATSAANLETLKANALAKCANLTAFEILPGATLYKLLPLALGGCASLKGEIGLPTVSNLSSTSFEGCLAIDTLRFSASNEHAVRSCEGYESSFGALNAVCVFD